MTKPKKYFELVDEQDSVVQTFKNGGEYKKYVEGLWQQGLVDWQAYTVFRTKRTHSAPAQIFKLRENVEVGWLWKKHKD